MIMLQIDKLLDGWFKRDKAPFFPQEQIRDARQRLHPSLRKRREKLATRIAATFVQTSKGKGLASYIPLDIPCMYGSFMPKLPSDATRNPSKASLVCPAENMPTLPYVSRRLLCNGVLFLACLSAVAPRH